MVCTIVAGRTGAAVSWYNSMFLQMHSKNITCLMFLECIWSDNTGSSSSSCTGAHKISLALAVSISDNTPPHRPSTVHDEDQTIPIKEDDLKICEEMFLNRLRNLEDALFYN